MTTLNPAAPQNSRPRLNDLKGTGVPTRRALDTLSTVDPRLTFSSQLHQSQCVSDPP
jgi:hypothetical protein